MTIAYERHAKCTPHWRDLIITWNQSWEKDRHAGVLVFFSCFYDTIIWPKQMSGKKSVPLSQITVDYGVDVKTVEAWSTWSYYIMVRRRAINRCTHEHVQLTFSTLLQFVIICLRNHSQWTEFLTLINPIKIIHHNTPISLVILGFKVTNLTVTISPLSVWHLSSSFLKHNLSTSDCTCSGPSYNIICIQFDIKKSPRSSTVTTI